MHWVILLSLVSPSSSFWWWLFSGGDPASNGQEKSNEGDQGVTTELSQMFAPFEMTSLEETFITEAKNYLQNLPMLDQCNMLIINRLKASCNQLSDEQLSRLSVNLLNCQSAVEGRKTYKCTDGMALSECTGPMDPDTWNSYHIVSNRARAICYNMRQAQFRMKTEQTVNELASSTLDNIHLLKGLAAGQQKIAEATDEAMLSISRNQDELLTNQNKLQAKQLQIGGALNDNMNNILKEKRLISLRHKQVEAYTQMINQQLTSLVEEIKSQDSAKKESEKEILKDLDSVKEKADEVLQKLDNAFQDMDSFHDSLEGKQNKTLKNLEEIQDTVAFMNQVLKKLYSSFHEQLPWLHEMVGGTVDKFTIVSCVIGHAGFFFASFLAVIFVNAPILTRALMLLLIPLNCFTTLNDFNFNLSFLQMAWILAGSVPAFYVFTSLYTAVMRFRYGEKRELILNNSRTPTKFTFDSTPLVNRTLEHSDLLAAGVTPINSSTSKRLRDEDEDIQRMSPVRNFNFSEFPSVNESPSTMNWSVKDQLDGSTSRLNTTIGGSVKCRAKTKTGLRCRNAAVGCWETCRRHAPKKE